jgi:hypothetical protein
MNEAQLFPAAEAAHQCKCCFEKINEADQFCQACGYPLKGSDAEQQIFIYRRGFKKADLHEHDKKIKKAGTTLYVLAGVFLLYGLIYFFIGRTQDTSSGILITNAAVAVIFLLLGAWAGKKPVASIISGIILYAVIILIGAIEDPASPFKGIIFKIIVISYLIKGLVSTQEAEKIKKQHNI